MFENLIYYLSTHYSILILTTTMLGLLIGSFLNVIISRLPILIEQNFLADSVCYLAENQQHNILRLAAQDAVVTVRGMAASNFWHLSSHCKACGSLIKLCKIIPLIGFILTRSRCKKCTRTISLRDTFIEGLCGAMFGFLAWKWNWGWPLAGSLTLTAALIALAFIDLDTKFLPDDLTLPLLWMGLLFNLFFNQISLVDSVLGAVCGYLALWLFFHFFKLFTGKESFGYGDFKLLAALGAWLGWSMLPFVIILSSIMGAFSGMLWVICSKSRIEQRIPFGPYLAIAGWITMNWGGILKVFIYRSLGEPGLC
ncbi:hypothetical protein BUE93_09275 [Chromobacterium amazonense]|uniref:Prepilin leader peptidase/N-methyltransferase n=1 Tax=Chromobacterium amazonense TaxID=1382803 RepID=A0A2S9X5K0_9NEIS|nr:A24 family peptidase [Chromobacterium amazonense]PRP70955.1 hypothetical protein BUE93_09275 [Chromobacterium amazonense]